MLCPAMCMRGSNEYLASINQICHPLFTVSCKGARTTVLKRAVDQKYGLKNKASRAFFNEVNKKFPTLPFSLRAFEDEQAVKLGVRECVNHKLLQPYHVLEEKKGEVVAHVKFTVLLMPNGTLQVSGLPPVTFDAMCAAGLASGEDVPLMGGNIGAILAKKVAVERGIEVDEAIMTVLNEVRTGLFIFLPNEPPPPLPLSPPSLFLPLLPSSHRHDIYLTRFYGNLYFWAYISFFAFIWGLGLGWLLLWSRSNL